MFHGPSSQHDFHGVDELLERYQQHKKCANNRAIPSRFRTAIFDDTSQHAIIQAIAGTNLRPCVQNMVAHWIWRIYCFLEESFGSAPNSVHQLRKYAYQPRSYWTITDYFLIAPTFDPVPITWKFDTDDSLSLSHICIDEIMSWVLPYHAISQRYYPYYIQLI